MVTMQRESTEFLYVGWTGDIPDTSAEIAFLQAGQRPDAQAWETAIIVDGDQHDLWDDAQASDAQGDWYAAILIGTYGNDGIDLEPGDWQLWGRLTDTTEQPVRIAPTTVTIEGDE